MSTPTGAGRSRVSAPRRACLLVAFSLLLSGCTSVVFTHPSGKPVPAADADEFRGEWIGQKGILWRVDREPAAVNLVARWNGDGKEQHRTLIFTQVRDHVALVWVEETELGGYMPLRLSGAEDALALLYPKVDEAKRLVAEGKLTGTFDKEKNYWLIASGDWDAALESPAFWEIDNCLPFVRSKSAAAPAPPPPPAAPPAARPPPPPAPLGMNIVRIYHSPEHNYFGHHGRDPGTAPMYEVARARLLAGRGVDGDRFALEAGAKGQVTFFALETWSRLCRELGRDDRQPDVFRRNIIVRGADLNALVGRDFVVQGVRFHGVEYCKPCYWMDRAFAPGTFALLTEWKAGGLRAGVLSDGWLSSGADQAQQCSA